MRRDALISIHPKHVESILSGVKTVELRKRIPSIQVGLRLWIYSTRPVGALVGTAEVAEVQTGSPNEIWNVHHENVGICREQFERYYGEARIAHGISLVNVQNGRPVDICTLRRIRPKFHPPQVMSYITQDEAASFQEYLFEREDFQ